MTKIPLAIVAAVGRNGAIGSGGRLPWSLPSDLARFRDLTMGKPMIMGRRTFESIGRVLPGRESIVVSGDRSLALPKGAHLAPTPEAARHLAGRCAHAMRASEVCLIGGAILFEHMLGQADRLFMTFVDLAPDADAFFPRIDETVWRETRRRIPDPHRSVEVPCVFVDYVRR